MESNELLKSGLLLSHDCQSHSLSFCVCELSESCTVLFLSARILCLFFLTNLLIHALRNKIKQLTTPTNQRPRPASCQGSSSCPTSHGPVLIPVPPVPIPIPIPTPPPIPNTALTQVISRSHENTVKGDERTNSVKCSERNRWVFYCQDTCEIPHEPSLLV